jgi:hypothetical protein
MIVTEVTTAIATRPATRLYSIAVAPDVSFEKARRHRDAEKCWKDRTMLN